MLPLQTLMDPCMSSVPLGQQEAARI
jgi:hypothetical protein